MNKQEIENQKREKLKREKPLVYEKIIKLADKQRKGEPTCRIDIGYSYACNLKCNHCMADRFQKKTRSLTPADLRSIAEQADAQGWAQFNISGGEPLIHKNFDEILTSLMPDKFHIGISTNGYFLTKEKAKHLKEIGLDKVMISVDSIDPEIHCENRNDEDAFDKAYNAILNARDAGLDVVIQTVVTHQNAQSQELFTLAEYCQKRGYSLDLVLGKAIGEWEGKHEILITPDDAKYLRHLNMMYPAARRDIFPSYGRRGGCGMLKGCFHVTQYGDVLICVFAHISIGNIFDEPLIDIVQRGMKIKYIKNHSPICLAGEDRNFINKYMSRFYGKPLPVYYTEIFDKEDYED